jgi:hypothetical protein
MIMSELGELRVGRKSPGLIIVALAFLSMFALISFSRDSVINPIIIYVAIGLIFVLTVSGIVLMFRSDVVYPLAGETPLAVGSSDIEQAVGQLAKNYDILRRQVTQGFILAGTFMALGILVILTGSLGDMFGFTKSTSNLTTVAGVIVEVVSGLGLYLFKETFKQLNSTSDKLYEMWKVLAAFKKADDLPVELKSQVTVSLIGQLVGVRLPAIPPDVAPSRAEVENAP